eukprot:9207802-Lingulodinium_polyedra.AAC.1
MPPRAVSQGSVVQDAFASVAKSRVLATPARNAGKAASPKVVPPPPPATGAAPRIPYLAAAPCCR